MATSNLQKTGPPFLDFIKDLNVQDCFPQKLTLQDSLVINSTIKPNISYGTNNSQHLLHLMLEQIKMSNYKFRNVLLYKKVEVSSTSYDSDSDASDNDDEETNSVLVHPMDALLALIHCADNFLRQDMFLKLVSCQVAIPILLPDPLSDKIILPLWAMRSILKNWKTKSPNDMNWTPCEGRLIESETRMISFMRFSHPGNYSKSNILNSVISDSKHEFFFSYASQGSSSDRRFVEGLVEACWYLPTGEDSDLFNDILMFANLRGNASSVSNSQQFSFLLSNSFISFVFMLESDISEQNLERFTQAKGKIFFLFPSCSKSKANELKQLIPNSAVVELSRKAPPEIVNSIRSRIVSKMSKDNSPLFQLSQCLISNNFNIDIDENESTACLQGKVIAEEIKQKLKESDTSCLKEKIVPLQGRSLWHDWADHNKTQNRVKEQDTGNKKIQEFLKEHFDKKLSIRQKQCLMVKSLPFVMSQFILVLLEHSQDVKAYFLQWLKFILDDQSRFILPKLQEACKKTREDLRKKETSEYVKKQLQDQLKIQDTQLIDASFGVEHLFRELGQIYESVMEVEKSREEKLKVKKLATIVANLLLAGHPLEIVDGDAAHIPIQWVQAVLSEVMKLIPQSSTLFVLSVLGIQSTGKSTLMNTMFGVRFSVSAGRCTRGAYLQILKLQSNDSKCNYMLIIDTEGLRAPELDSSQTHQHDNELAALVIGLAGVTIVNMFGEVPADISDILQTTVHAFLRMKKAEMQHTPSCQFVRHHVASVSSAKTSEGSDKFQETLNDMTKLAAKAERYGGQYEQFSDVIMFNNKTDVQNFPSLWEGNPPMAPVNPAYCEAAHKLRTKFLQLATLPNSLCTLNIFQLRLTTLWNAILKENFVFSFKNTLEVEAFSKLDAQFGEWAWELQSIVIKWETGTSNSIMSADLDKIIEVKDEVAEVKSRLTEIKDELTKIQDERIKLIHNELDSQYEDIQKRVGAFFEDSPPTIATTMIKWKAEYEIKLEKLKDSHKAKAIQYCKGLADQRRARRKVDDMRNTEVNRINRELKLLVRENKVTDGTELTKEDLDVIEKKFDESWDQWMKEIYKSHPLPQGHNIQDKIIYCLRSKCGLRMLEQLIVEKEKQTSIKNRGHHLPLTACVEPGKHLNTGKLQRLKEMFLSTDDCQVAQTATEKFLADAQSDFASLKGVPYDDHHIVSVVRKLLQSIDAFDDKKGNFTFTAEYRIDLILEVAGYALTVFTESRKKELAEHPATYLDSLKEGYKKSFYRSCQTTLKEKELAKELVRLVKKGMYQSLPGDLLTVVVQDVKDKENHVFGSKERLTGHLLLHLLNEDNFCKFNTYLKNVRRSYTDYIYYFIRSNYWEKKRSRIISLARDIVRKKTSEIKDKAEAVKYSIRLHELKNDQFNCWLTEFRSSILSISPVSNDELNILKQDTEGVDVYLFDKDFFKEFKLEQCDEEKLAEIYERYDIQSIVSNLCNHLTGCCKQCVFCNEQCQFTYEHKGYHKCTLHRPQCLGGWRNTVSNEMILETCTELVASDGCFYPSYGCGYTIPYKEYNSHRRTLDRYREWDISKEARGMTSYWQWFIFTYQKDLEESERYKVSNIEEGWSKLNKGHARDDIKKNFPFNCCCI